MKTRFDFLMRSMGFACLLAAGVSGEAWGMGKVGKFFSGQKKSAGEKLSKFTPFKKKPEPLPVTGSDQDQGANTGFSVSKGAEAFAQSSQQSGSLSRFVEGEQAKEQDQAQQNFELGKTSQILRFEDEDSDVQVRNNIIDDLAVREIVTKDEVNKAQEKQSELYNMLGNQNRLVKEATLGKFQEVARIANEFPNRPAVKRFEDKLTESQKVAWNIFKENQKLIDKFNKENLPKDSKEKESERIQETSKDTVKDEEEARLKREKEVEEFKDEYTKLLEEEVTINIMLEKTPIEIGNSKLSSMKKVNDYIDRQMKNVRIIENRISQQKGRFRESSEEKRDEYLRDINQVEMRLSREVNGASLYNRIRSNPQRRKEMTSRYDMFSNQDKLAIQKLKEDATERAYEKFNKELAPK